MSKTSVLTSVFVPVSPAAKTGTSKFARINAKQKTLTSAVYGGFGLLVLLAVWWLLTVPFTAPNSLVAHFAPVPSLQALFALLGGADNMWLHIGVSLKRVAVA